MPSFLENSYKNINEKINFETEDYIKKVKEKFKEIINEEKVKQFQIVNVKEQNIGEILVINKKNNNHYFEFSKQLINIFKENKKIIDGLTELTFEEFYDAEKRFVNIKKGKENYRSETSDYTNMIEAELKKYNKYISKFSEYRYMRNFTLGDYLKFFKNEMNFKGNILKKTNYLVYLLNNDTGYFRKTRNKSSHGDPISYDDYVYIRDKTFKIFEAIQELDLSRSVIDIH